MVLDLSIGTLKYSWIPICSGFKRKSEVGANPLKNFTNSIQSSSLYELENISFDTVMFSIARCKELIMYFKVI